MTPANNSADADDEQPVVDAPGDELADRAEETDPTSETETADTETAAAVASEPGAGDNGTGDIDDADGVATVEITEEAVIGLIAERDEYLESLQRLKADFANARRRSDEQASELRRYAATDLVTKLLPVLDSVQAALDQGVEEVRPVGDALFEVLAGQGLARLDPLGEAFNPEVHEAVMFESGDDEQQVVVETMRLGYQWNDRVLRPAMVKVRG